MAHSFLMKVQSCGFFEKFFCVVKKFFCVAKIFFLGFYWLKTVGKSSASTPCNQKIGFATGTWKLKKIQIRPKKSKKIQIFFFHFSMACGGSNRAESRGRSFFAIKLQDFWLFWLFYIEGVTFFLTFLPFHPKYGLW